MNPETSIAAVQRAAVQHASVSYLISYLGTTFLPNVILVVPTLPLLLAGHPPQYHPLTITPVTALLSAIGTPSTNNYTDWFVLATVKIEITYLGCTFLSPSFSFIFSIFILILSPFF